MESGPSTKSIELSVVVEWENVLLAEQARGTRMLERLAGQSRALGRVTEVIVVCDPGEHGTASLQSTLTRYLGPAEASDLPWRIVEAPGEHYYDLKNRGVEETRGPLVVFVDSDVVPDDGWLAALTAPFADPNVQMVAGNSYLEPRGLYGRAMALGWFFPRRSENPIRHDRGVHFWANNVAFRRELIAAHPFPRPQDGSTRGACSNLAHRLRAAGVSIWVDTGAQVCHPAPNGGHHFFVRAIAEGRDSVFGWLRAGKRRWRLPLRIVRRFGKTTLRAFGRTLWHHRSVRLPLLQVPAAWAIQGTYYGLASAGAFAAWLAPGFMSRRFRV